MTQISFSLRVEWFFGKLVLVIMARKKDGREEWWEEDRQIKLGVWLTHLISFGPPQIFFNRLDR